MISVTSFAYVAGVLVLAGVYAMWRAERPATLGWGLTAACHGAAVLAVAYARWWGIEDGHTLAAVLIVAGFVMRAGGAGHEGSPAAEHADGAAPAGEGTRDVEERGRRPEEVEYGP